METSSGKPTLVYHKTKNILVSSYYGYSPCSNSTTKGKLVLKNSLLYIESLIVLKNQIMIH
eukprot:UN22971